MDNTNYYEFYKRYLVDGEYVLWEGKPEKGNIFTGKDIALSLFGVGILSFLIFWEAMAFKSGVAFAIFWGIPFLGVGAYMTFGRIIQTAYLRNKTFYVITNKKIIIKSGRKITMHDSRDLPPMEVEIHKNGNGTIIFSEQVYTRRGRSHHTYFMLENLADVAQAQNAISSMDE